MVLAVAMAATALSGCWALMGQPQDLAQTRAVIQRENVAADEVAEEREIRDMAVADYRACLHDGGSVRHCSAYLYAQSGAYGWGNGTGLYGLESVAQGAARDIAIARGEQQDGLQNATIRGLRNDLGAETTARVEADAVLTGLVEDARGRADKAQERADAAYGRASSAHGRLDKAGAQMHTVDAAARGRDGDLHRRLAELEARRAAAEADGDGTSDEEGE